ncbi:MAG: primosome assembly protein PriA, partial [Frankiaceae bacterium]
GYAPSVACANDRTPARCGHCQGPLALGRGDTAPACRWCGRPAADWACPACGGRALRAVVVGVRRTAEELGRAFPGVAVRTSGRDAVIAAVPGEPALVVATPGAEPVADGGYGAVLLLDAWALLGRPDLRAAEEALRRWLQAAALARPAGAGGRVVLTADAGLPLVQALVRWDPFGHAERELADRRALRFPPAARVAALTGPAAAVSELVAALDGAPAGELTGEPAAGGLPPSAELLGPVRVERPPGPTGPRGEAPAAGPGPPGEPVQEERLLIRVPRADGAALAAALKAATAVRSARKAAPVKVQLDPLVLL